MILYDWQTSNWNKMMHTSRNLTTHNWLHVDSVSNTYRLEISHGHYNNISYQLICTILLGDASLFILTVLWCLVSFFAL